MLKFATGNDNKLREAQEILGIALEKADVGDLDEIQTVSVEELIRRKAYDAYVVAGEPVMVEDTGLSFDAWNGLPGALIKWFLKSVHNEWILQMLAGYEDRRATALCFVASYNGKDYKIASGKVRWMISAECRGENGFGWDDIFIPEGTDKTFAQMSASEKNAFSMRRRAFENFAKL